MLWGRACTAAARPQVSQLPGAIFLNEPGLYFESREGDLYERCCSAAPLSGMAEGLHACHGEHLGIGQMDGCLRSPCASVLGYNSAGCSILEQSCAAFNREQGATQLDRRLCASSMQPRRREPLASPPKAATTSFDGFSDAPVSLQPVFTAALVASLGAFCFGFHLAVLNGPLAAIAAELGFAGQPVLEGLVGSA